MDFVSRESNKLILKLKVGDNKRRELVVHGDKQEKPTTCSLCGKSFPSYKALYGHMRCHPDRVYRGMQLPEALKSATKSQPLMAVDDTNNTIDSIKRRPVKPVKAKRRSVVEKGAIYALMLMATGDERYRYLDNGTIEDEDKVQKSPISNKKPRLVVHGSTSDDQQQDCADSQSDTIREKRKRQTDKVKDSVLSDQQINNPADEIAVFRSYKCSICDKTFATHQALGGHKSSTHSKYQLDHQQGSIHDELMSLPHPPPAPATATTVSEGVHICKICDKAFSSGQALGGHMRCHWTGPASPSSSSSPASIPGQVQLPMMRSDGPDHSGSSTAAAEITRQLLDFDLNQFPGGDTEDQGNKSL